MKTARLLAADAATAGDGKKSPIPWGDFISIGAIHNGGMGDFYMETLILLGAGQMGKAALGLVNRAHYTVLAFADNQPALHGTTLGTYPVLSVEEAVAKNPTHILIAVAGQERTEALRIQLRTLGYTGGVHTLQAFADALDIRSAVFSRLADRLDTLPGALAELGVYRGDFAAALNRRFPERTLYLFDTFAGFDARDIADEQSAGLSRAGTGDFSDTSEA